MKKIAQKYAYFYYSNKHTISDHIFLSTHYKINLLVYIDSNRYILVDIIEVIDK